MVGPSFYHFHCKLLNTNDTFRLQLYNAYGTEKVANHRVCRVQLGGPPIGGWVNNISVRIISHNHLLPPSFPIVVSCLGPIVQQHYQLNYPLHPKLHYFVHHPIFPCCRTVLQCVHSNIIVLSQVLLGSMFVFPPFASSPCHPYVECFAKQNILNFPTVLPISYNTAVVYLSYHFHFCLVYRPNLAMVLSL